MIQRKWNSAFGHHQIQMTGWSFYRHLPKGVAEKRPMLELYKIQRRRKEFKPRRYRWWKCAHQAHRRNTSRALDFLIDRRADCCKCCGGAIFNIFFKKKFWNVFWVFEFCRIALLCLNFTCKDENWFFLKHTGLSLLSSVLYYFCPFKQPVCQIITWRSVTIYVSLWGGDVGRALYWNCSRDLTKFKKYALIYNQV